ncbi:MAG: hypothetical protein ACRD2C_18520 [Acidimicrobiales bacterium]
MEWIALAGVVAAVIVGLATVAATLYARRPTRAAARMDAAAARSEARKVDIGFGMVGAGAKGAPGFHDGLKLQVHNRSAEHVLAVAAWADRDNKPGPWWLASDGLGPDESAELRLPAAWPCEVHVYYLDHLERAWRRRVNGHGVGDVEQVDPRDWPTIEPRRRRWWRRAW